MGRIGLYAELIVMACSFTTGPIMDIFGRKYPIILGLFFAGIFICLIPCFHEVFPYFFLCRVGISVSTIFILNVPLLPDYV